MIIVVFQVPIHVAVIIKYRMTSQGFTTTTFSQDDTTLLSYPYTVYRAQRIPWSTLSIHHLVYLPHPIKWHGIEHRYLICDTWSGYLTLHVSNEPLLWIRLSPSLMMCFNFTNETKFKKCMHHLVYPPHKVIHNIEYTSVSLNWLASCMCQMIHNLG